jgi:hypothetical protein
MPSGQWADMWHGWFNTQEYLERSLLLYVHNDTMKMLEILTLVGPQTSAQDLWDNTSTDSNPLLVSTHLKFITTRTFGIQLWGTASNSDIEILERFQSKALSMIVDATSYVPNTFIRRDLQMLIVKEEIRHYSSQYSARISAHPNDLIVNLIELPNNRRLRRHLPNDLPTRFLV